MVGGSSAASMAPAALALAYQFFGNPAYIQAAEEGADFLYRRDLCQGVTTGGPGEILQCPDSESAFGLLESFVVLHEVTGAGRWLDCAEDAACQCSSWVVDNNYRFPEGSEFDRLGIRTTGSVFANVQNKHAAPGICTLSGNSLLKLYRATGKRAYLNLMGDIARFILPCMSREDRPARSWDRVPEMLPPGFICERVNMSDWEGSEKVGGVFAGSCWSEVSQMLTWMEIPGVYAASGTDILEVVDGVEAFFDATGALVVQNPFPCEVTVKVLMEDEIMQRQPLGATYEARMKRVSLAALGNIRLPIEK